MKSSYILPAVLFSAALLSQAQAQNAEPPLPPSYQTPVAAITTSAQGSTYVPMDSWIYPALDRLHALGYLDSAFLGIRPWTRLAIAHMLQMSADRIDSDTNNDEAKDIYLAVLREVQPDIDNASDMTHPTAELDQVYEQVRGISGLPLRDSFHLGQTIVNDYGRPINPDSTTTPVLQPARKRDALVSTTAANSSTPPALPATLRPWRNTFPRPWI